MEKKTFVLMEKKGDTFANTKSTFVGRLPSIAAAKAARKGLKAIFLRETGTQVIREYAGKTEKKVLKNDTPFAKKGTTVTVGKAKYVKIVSK